MTGPQLVKDITSHPLWTSAADGLALVDRDGTIRGTNDSLRGLFGFDADDLDGNPIEMLIPIEARNRHVVNRSRFEARPEGRPMLDGLHFRGMKADGSTFPVNVGLSRIATAEGPMSLASIRDLTQRERSESELAIALHRTALIDEQRRIANDLHDTVVQRLFALGLSLNLSLGQIVDDSVRATLDKTVDTIDEIIVDIRDSIYGLQAVGPFEESVTERALGVIAEMESSLSFSLDVDIDSDVDDIANPLLIEHLLKVLREAISNISRHAAATTARIEISCLDAQLVLVVHDDGRGLADPSPGHGLASMRRRAEGLGGTLDISSANTTGTRLVWVVPLSSERPSPE